MKLSNLKFIANSFSIEENESKCLDLGDIGIFEISLTKKILKYPKYCVTVRNATKLKFLDPIEDYDHQITYFENLGQAKVFAEVVYSDFVSKLIGKFSYILDNFVNVLILEKGSEVNE